MKIVIAGANGFVGRHLRDYFIHHDLVLLARHPKQGEHFWDPQQGLLDPKLLTGADVVINLAGESVAGRWSTSKISLIAQSRYQATKLLTQALSQESLKLYIGASAIGYYGADQGDNWLQEQSPAGQGILSPICQQWEALHRMVPCQRVILARFGLILGRGGMLAKMLPIFRLGLGGVLGSGSQWMSWIAIQDVCQIIKFCIENEGIAGPVNFTAPEPVTNLQWTKMLGKALRRPTFLGVPRWVILGLMGSSSELVLGSLRVAPKKLLSNKYDFTHKDVYKLFESLV